MSVNHFNHILETCRSARWSHSKKAVSKPKFPMPLRFFLIAPCAKHDSAKPLPRAVRPASPTLLVIYLSLSLSLSHTFTHSNLPRPLHLRHLTE